MVRILLAIVKVVDLTPTWTPSLLHFVLRPLVRVVARVFESRTSTTKSSATFRTMQPADCVFRPLKRNTGREKGSVGVALSSDDSWDDEREDMRTTPDNEIVVSLEGGRRLSIFKWMVIMERGERGAFLRPFEEDGRLRESMEDTVADSVDVDASNE